MPNPQKGEVELVAGEKAYVIHFSIDALCALEERTGKGMIALFDDMTDPKKMSLGLVRNVLHAGLSEHYPEMTVKEAGEIIPASGGMLDVWLKLSKAMELAFPNVEASGTPRPPNRAARRKVGTGPAS